MCIIESRQGREGGHAQHEIQELQTAYQTALKRLKGGNKEAEEKKRGIKEQMQVVLEQMRRLKGNSDEIEEKLY